MRDFLSEMAVTGTFACCLKILTCVLPLGTLKPELVLFSLVAVFPEVTLSVLFVRHMDECWEIS